MKERYRPTPEGEQNNPPTFVGSLIRRLDKPVTYAIAGGLLTAVASGSVNFGIAAWAGLGYLFGYVKDRGNIEPVFPRG